MHNIVKMKILYGFDGLGEVNEGLRLREFIFSVLVVKEIASFCVLKDHVQIFLIDNSIPQRGYMRMTDLTMKFDLPFYEFDFVLWGNIFEADNFNGIVFIGGSVNGKFNNTEGTISKFFLFKDMELLDSFEMTFRNNFHMILSIVINSILL